MKALNSRSLKVCRVVSICFFVFGSLLGSAKVWEPIFCSALPRPWSYRSNLIHIGRAVSRLDQVGLKCGDLRTNTTTGKPENRPKCQPTSQVAYVAIVLKWAYSLKPEVSVKRLHITTCECYRAVGQATPVDGVGGLVNAFWRRRGTANTDDADTTAAERNPASRTVVTRHHLRLYVHRVFIFFAVQHHDHV